MKYVSVLLLSTTFWTSVSANETRTWSGKWNNRKYGTSGPLKCVAQQSKPGQWSARFSGTFKGDPFEYRVEFESGSARGDMALAGKATISGHPYQWTGSIDDRQLTGSYKSSNGNNGTFVLRESSRRSQPSSEPNETAVTAQTTSATAGKIRKGEKLLFIGNSFMANEGGVFNYVKKALEVGGSIKIETDSIIDYGRPLSAMVKPDVGRAMAASDVDRVVITSGQLTTMRKFVSEIRNVGKQPIVFMTWEPRHPGNRGTEQSYTDATRRSVRTLRRLQKETGAIIIPAAVVYHDLTLQPPDGTGRVDFLWHPANIHQNALGTMVNAWMFYAILSGSSPVGVNFDMAPFVAGETLQDEESMRLTPELRTALQQRVWEVAQAWNAGKTHLD